MEVIIQGQQFFLDPRRAIWWQEAKTLITADLHLGKVAHFRNNGFAVPAGLSDQNLRHMSELISEYQPARMLFLGDLFHSVFNEAWIDFSEFRAAFPEISFDLVRGNHDILKPTHYLDAGLTVHPEPLLEDKFMFSHHPQKDIPSELYNLCGHIHPGVILEGNGRQTMKLPCFYFSKNQGILPAYGSFTGAVPVSVVEGDQVFVIGEGTVFSVC